ncbi:MAG: glycoside hydrolase family 5 protein [Fimbriimonadaceae bacterium]|nr:glycoside hydrolase family 5 protein [Fimbriimonadaceae bacterium]
MKVQSHWLATLGVAFLFGCGGGGGNSVGNGPDPDPNPTPPVSTDLSRLPNGLGVDIRQSIAPNSEWDLLAAGGFNLVRFNMHWSSIEKQPGVYHFKQDGQDYDALVTAMANRGIRILFILAYDNPLYDGGYTPFSATGRAAFARFAAACASRYREKSIIWEIWNEPNIDQFWRRSPNDKQPPAESYAELAKQTLAAMRQADPNAFIVGPAVGPLDDPEVEHFISTLGENGALAQFDAISVHPYRHEPPETVLFDYDNLRSLIRQHTGTDKPIFNTESGRSTGIYPGVPRISEEEQAERLVRTFLTDVMAGVQLTVWFNWANLGSNPDDIHSNFGVVTQARQPKAAYTAAKQAAQFLEGFRLAETLDRGTSGAYALRFDRNGETRLALWGPESSRAPVVVRIPAGTWQVLDWQGKALGTLLASGEATMIDLTSSPIFLKQAN